MDKDQVFLDALKKEVARARAKFPNQNHMMVALMEEVGELAEAFLKGDMLNAYKEADQVAAVAMRVATGGDLDFDF